MTLTETSELLALTAAYDQRKVGKVDVAAWWEQLKAFTFADCRAAVLGHYRDTTDRLMPAHVRGRVHEIRAARVPRLDYADYVPDVHPESDDYVRLLQARREDVLNGATLEQAIAAHPVDPVEEARAVERLKVKMAELGAPVRRMPMPADPADRAAALKAWAKDWARP